MITLLLTVFLVVLISAICSMTEAALYSVPWTYIENLRKQGSATGELLYQLRSRIDQPIAAVLTLNTVANTAGAAIAGAVAANVLGADNTALFAAGLTILILALGEILPKTLGVAHACGVASGMARPLRLMVLIFKPFIWFSSMLTRLVASPQSGPSATEDDIRAITSLSRQTGRIQQYEENAIRNILSLDVKHVREIMTPRTMVFSLQEDISVKDAYNHPQILFCYFFNTRRSFQSCHFHTIRVIFSFQRHNFRTQTGHMIFFLNHEPVNQVGAAHQHGNDADKLQHTPKSPCIYR